MLDRTDEIINDNFSDHFSANISIWINSNIQHKLWLLDWNINIEEDTLYKVFRHRFLANPDRG